MLKFTVTRRETENRILAKQRNKWVGLERTTKAKTSLAWARAKASKTKARGKACLQGEKGKSKNNGKGKQHGNNGEKGVHEMEGHADKQETQTGQENTEWTDTSWTDADWWPNETPNDANSKLQEVMDIMMTEKRSEQSEKSNT